jgi:hypothetical protein
MTTHYMPGSLAGWHCDPKNVDTESKHSPERVEGVRSQGVRRDGTELLGRIAVAIIALLASPIFLPLMLVLAVMLFPLLPFLGAALALGSAAQDEAPAHHSSYPDDVAHAHLPRAA